MWELELENVILWLKGKTYMSDLDIGAENPYQDYAAWKSPNINPELQQNSLERSSAQSGFAEWCKMNGSVNPDLYNRGDLTASEKYDSVFRDGANKLMAELRDPKDGGVKLIDKLDIPKLKAELAVLREKGDIAELGKREEEIAKYFQRAISEYPYNSNVCHVAEILSKKEMNCVGASVLGGALLDEVGVNYLAGHIGNHTLLIMATSDGRILWQDMQDGLESSKLENEELTAEIVEGQKDGGENITPQDIVAYANNPKNIKMSFFVKKEQWKDLPIVVSPPELGLEARVLINTGFMLGNTGKNAEAIEILKLAMQKTPDDAEVYQGLARAYKNMGHYKEAVDVFTKALEIDPSSDYFKSVMDELVRLAS